jgi:hypothetical protein
LVGGCLMEVDSIKEESVKACQSFDLRVQV